MKYLCPRDFRRGEMEEKMKDVMILTVQDRSALPSPAAWAME